VTKMETAKPIEATPAVLIDLPQVQRNIRKLADYAREHRIDVRPHTKTHKSQFMARLQIESGAIGLAAAKVGEAEIMADVSPDILIAYPASDPARTKRIAALAKRATVRVALDCAEAIERAGEAARSAGSTVGVLVDLDIGFHRTGVATPAASLELARLISRTKSLRLDGIFFYPGHVWSLGETQLNELRGIDAILAEAVALWEKDGLKAELVSGGSTPTAYQSHVVKSQTEIRPGTFLYNDMNTARAGFCTLDECAARIVCTVVSTTVPEKVVIDAGTKTLTSDRNVTLPDSGHGHVVEYPSAKITRLSEEHGELDVSACETRPKLGEQVQVIPNHICPCVNLQDEVWLRMEDGSLQMLRVDTRGKLT
jgi:D-serine deaminase-like pyridoxal phosphate-dependent protein